MKPRERLLAIIVGCLALVFVGRWAWGLVTSPLNSRYAQLEQLDKDIAKQNDIAFDGKKADRKLRLLVPQSLPDNLEVAKEGYRLWLSQAARDVGFTGPSVTPQNAILVSVTDKNRKNLEAYHHIQYTLNATGNLEQLTKFLHQFYKPGYLHKITKLTFTPQNAGQFAFVIMVDAVVIPKANKGNELPKGEAQRLALASYDDYRREIVERNLFAPANNPPVLTEVAAQTANPGAKLEVQLAATDADQGDTLKYELVSGPEGASVDATSGKFTWQPKPDQVGQKLDAEVKVSDSRPKPESATRKFTINVAPGAPSFEQSKQAFVTAIVQVNEGPQQVWLHERTTNKKALVSEGEEFQLGEVRGRVTRIGRREIEIEVGGQKIVWPWGKSLFDAQEAAKGSAASEAAKVSRAPS
ncbi:MAG: putative Ig domain-containing protein [Pirellulales bacterium]